MHSEVAERDVEIICRKRSKYAVKDASDIYEVIVNCVNCVIYRPVNLNRALHGCLHFLG